MIILLMHIAQAKIFSDQTLRTKRCPKYTCAETQKDFCLYATGKDFVLQKCPSNTYCSLNGQCESFKSKYTTLEAFPGEVCNEEIKCLYGRCSKGICEAKEENEPCNKHEECNPGFRCSGTCQPLLKVGSKGCFSDFDCANFAGCNFGKCEIYFSLEEGAQVELCENFKSYLCKSSLCEAEKCLGSYSVNPMPKECRSHLDCQAMQGHLYSSCECGYNQEGTSYCLPLPGNTQGKNFLGALSDWLKSSGVSKCNTARRISPHCIWSHWDYLSYQKFLMYSYEYKHYTGIVNNPECVKQSLTQDYWEIFETFQESLKEA